MKKFLLSLGIFLLSLGLLGAQKKEDRRTMEWKYEMQCAGVSGEGSYLVKVFTYSKRPNFPFEQAKKNAIHGILFKGVPGDRAKKCAEIRPMISNLNAEVEHEAYFKEFFENGGKYMKFVGNSTNGMLDPNDVMKVGKEYKIGALIVISKDMLRRELEDAGIIRSLKSF